MGILEKSLSSWTTLGIHVKKLSVSPKLSSFHFSDLTTHVMSKIRHMPIHESFQVQWMLLSLLKPSTREGGFTFSDGSMTFLARVTKK